MRDFQVALDEVASFGELPRGTLRINANKTAARLLPQTAEPVFLNRYPDMSFDRVTESRLVDVVAAAPDAGLDHYGRSGSMLAISRRAIAAGMTAFMSSSLARC